jgi:hypothetical protein
MLKLRYNPFGSLSFYSSFNAVLTCSDEVAKSKKRTKATEVERDIAPTAPVPHTGDTTVSQSTIIVEKSSPPLPKSTEASIMMSPALSAANGLNGAHTPPLSPAFAQRPKMRARPSSRASTQTGGRIFSQSTQNGRQALNGYKLGLVQESAIAMKRTSTSELGVGVYQTIEQVSFVNFLEWIRAERLTTLPHQGSRWDRVLIRALYFAEQLHRFDTAIQGFAIDSNTAAALGYGHAKLLLEVRTFLRSKLALKY